MYKNTQAWLYKVAMNRANIIKLKEEKAALAVLDDPEINTDQLPL